MDRRQNFGSGLFGTSAMEIPGKSGLKTLMQCCEVSACFTCVLETAQCNCVVIVLVLVDDGLEKLSFIGVHF